MKKIYFILAIVLPMFASGQYVFNAYAQNVKFGGPGVTITNKSGNGTTAGSVILYQNVVNIGGQQIDAIIRTVSVSAGAYMVFDQAGTGTGYTNNNPTWFSPQFLFPAGGGNAVFEFEFILGNSFVNATNTGTTATLLNMMINSYDIDGNDSVGSNQFSEFGGFFTSEMATTTNIATTYNATTNLTRFASTISTNVVNAADPNTRVRVSYEEMSTFKIAVGAGAAGVAYFFIDFDKGLDFGVPTKVISAPNMDLNTTTSGTGNATTTCSGKVNVDAGATNIMSSPSTPSGGTSLERLRVTFPISDIKDGANEVLKIKNDELPLNFVNGAVMPVVKAGPTNYTVTAQVVGTERSLIFMKQGSTTMTLAEGERLLDEMEYDNKLSQPTVGTRTFEIRSKDGAYEGQAYIFTVGVGFNPTISQQPQAKIITVNTGTSFTVTANAASYQWQVNPGTPNVWSNVTNSAIYSGATTNTLTLSNVPSTMNGYTYRAITSNIACVKNSSNASLSVLAILPVKWLNVTGAVQNGGILIKWGTSTEINTSSFIIQHSIDGKNFTGVGEVNAAGNSAANTYYSFLHTQPSSANNYYRIEQVDADGKSTFSKIITVGNGGEAATITVLGNPVSNGQLSIQISQPLNLMLFSADGKLVKQQQAVAGTHNINVNGLSKGLYTLLAGTQAKRIIINN